MSTPCGNSTLNRATASRAPRGSPAANFARAAPRERLSFLSAEDASWALDSVPGALRCDKNAGLGAPGATTTGGAAACAEAKDATCGGGPLAISRGRGMAALVTTAGEPASRCSAQPAATLAADTP